jgi:hypothetical protein
MKLGNEYRTLVKVDDMDWCETMTKINSFKNRYARVYMKEMKKKIPEIFRPCPVIGEFKLVNVMPFDKFMSVIPPGDYLMQQRLAETTLKVNIDIEILWKVIR